MDAVSAPVSTSIRESLGDMKNNVLPTNGVLPLALCGLPQPPQQELHGRLRAIPPHLLRQHRHDAQVLLLGRLTESFAPTARATATLEPDLLGQPACHVQTPVLHCHVQGDAKLLPSLSVHVIWGVELARSSCLIWG